MQSLCVGKESSFKGETRFVSTSLNTAPWYHSFSHKIPYDLVHSVPQYAMVNNIYTVLYHILYYPSQRYY